MRIIVISPESADPREVPAMGGFFSAGLERYDVRKPRWGEGELEAWLMALPREWRPRLFIHEHHALAGRLGLGGTHDKDTGTPGGGARSRSCHDLPALEASVGLYESVIFGPVFASFTKRGHGPRADFPWDRLAQVLRGARTTVFAIGGIDAGRLERCRELGFSGAAVLGAVWNAADPAGAYALLREKALRLEAAPHAA
jgi:thiamine-phosphate pyrophosphorylase